MSALQPGLYLVHKPVGETSFEQVRTMAERRPNSEKRLRLCHGGTLDPFAEGLLIILAGHATKLMDLLHEVPKQYEAVFCWGRETDTGDGGGKTEAEGDASKVTLPVLDAALAPFLGWTQQVPPSTSAKKIGGEPAYRKVHRGESVQLPPSRVYLHQARWLSHDLPRSSVLELVSRGGYYVRALARDLGRGVGARAHLTALKRTRIGPWQDPPPGEETWLHGEELLPWFASRALDGNELYALKEGRTIPRGTVEPPPWRWPPGFPPPSTLVRGLHAGQLVFLLKDSDQGTRLSIVGRLVGGI